MNTEKVYILEDRGILYISGPDSEKFLQNLISNNIEKVNESKSCFASLLSPQGKFLFDFIVVKHKDGFLLDCEKRIIDQLYKKLVMYKLRSAVEILNLLVFQVLNNFQQLHQNKMHDYKTFLALILFSYRILQNL